jgi:hypothetical protein
LTVDDASGASARAHADVGHSSVEVLVVPAHAGIFRRARARVKNRASARLCFAASNSRVDRREPNGCQRARDV